MFATIRVQLTHTRIPEPMPVSTSESSRNECSEVPPKKKIEFRSSPKTVAE